MYLCHLIVSIGKVVALFTSQKRLYFPNSSKCMYVGDTSKDSSTTWCNWFAAWHTDRQIDTWHNTTAHLSFVSFACKMYVYVQLLICRCTYLKKKHLFNQSKKKRHDLCTFYIIGRVENQLEMLEVSYAFTRILLVCHMQMRCTCPNDSIFWIECHQ